MSIKEYEIYWHKNFPFVNKFKEDRKSLKRRPCIIIEVLDDSTAIAAEISSYNDGSSNFGKKGIEGLWEYDIPIPNYKEYGLSKPSAIRMVTCIQIKISDLEDMIGELYGRVKNEVEEMYNFLVEGSFKHPQLFGYWCERNNVKYISLNDPGRVAQTMYEIQESKKANSLDIALVIRDLCTAKGFDSCICCFKWKSGRGKFHSHLFTMFKEGKIIKSIHFLYGDRIMVNYNRASSFKQAIVDIKKIFNKAANDANKGFIDFNYNIVDNQYILKTVDNNKYNMTQEEILKLLKINPMSIVESSNMEF